MYSLYLSSVMVFRSWHRLHRACQLLWSQKSLGSPRCGMMWSTTVAFVIFFSFRQRTHKGCDARKILLARCHFSPYPRSDAVSLSWVCIGACSSQYICPRGTSLGQPGCLQGMSGILGISPSNRKAPEVNTSEASNHLFLSSV